MDSDKTDVAEELKDVMRFLPYPVTVVTATDGIRMRGITIGSFTSLSLDPALVSFNVARQSRMHDLMQGADFFVVHIPGSDQRQLCTRFALPDQEESEQFDGIDYRRADSSPPVLEGVIAEIHCRKFRMFEAGDHSIVIGEVRNVIKNRDEPSILYCKGDYQTLELD